MTLLTQSSTWQALSAHTQNLPHMRELFATDAARFKNMSLSACGLFLDYSKNRATAETLELLFSLAKDSQLEAKIKAMFAGEIINTTEKRAVLHTALRSKASQSIIAEGQDIVPEVQQTLSKMQEFVETVTSGQWKGYTGKAITDIVSIGIGALFLALKWFLKPYVHTGTKV